MTTDITRAVFIIRHPRSMGRVRLSFRPDHIQTTGQMMTHLVTRQPFVPDREMILRWQP